MKNYDYQRQQADLLARARESARVIDQQTTARVAREAIAGKKRIAPQRVDPPLLLPAQPTQTARPPQPAPPAPPARSDPFLQAILRRIQLGK